MLKVCLVHFPLGQTKSCLAGYPPPDDDLRNFLTACSIKVPVDGKNDEFTEFKDPECRVGYFLVELFKKTVNSCRRISLWIPPGQGGLCSIRMLYVGLTK